MSERPAPTADDIEPVKHETLDRIATGTVTIIPFLALGAIWLAGLGGPAGLERHRRVRDPLPAHGPRDHRRVPPPPDPPRVRDQPHRPRSPRRARLRRDRGPGHLVGGRPPQAPRLLGPRGRSAQPPRRARGRLAGRPVRPAPRPRRVAVHPHPAWRSGPLRPRSSARPRRELHRPHVRGVGPGRIRRGFRAGRGDRRNCRGRPHRPALGRRRPDVLPAPRDLQHQLDLPLLRPARVRHSRSLGQRAVAGAAVDGRVLAQQPPRLPHLRRPRAALVPDPHLRAGDLGDGEVRLVWDVVRVSPERQARKAASPA